MLEELKAIYADESLKGNWGIGEFYSEAIIYKLGMLFLLLFVVSIISVMLYKKLSTKKYNKIHAKLSKVNDDIKNIKSDIGVGNIEDDSVIRLMKSEDIENKKRLVSELRNFRQNKKKLISKEEKYFKIMNFMNSYSYKRLTNYLLNVILIGVVFNVGMLLCALLFSEDNTYTKIAEESNKILEEFKNNTPIYEMEIIKLEKIETNKYNLVYKNGKGVINERLYEGSIVEDDSIDGVYQFKYFPLKSDYEGTYFGEVDSEESENLVYGLQEPLIRLGVDEIAEITNTGKYINANYQ